MIAGVNNIETDDSGRGILGRVAIVGCGAIGLYYGGRLAAAGEDVVFVLRSDYAAVREHGIEVESVHGDVSLPVVKAVNSSESVGVVDWVVVAWKATANPCAEDVIRPLLGENTRILTLQNGLGNVEHFGELFGLDRVAAGLCFICVNRVAPGRVRHTASGLVRLADGARRGRTEKVQKFADALQGAGVKCEVSDCLEKALWMKLVWNFPFNGLAISEGGVDTEVLLKDLKLEGKVRRIMEEVVACAARLGHEIPSEFVEKQIALTKGMGAYKPSSMIDFVAGKEVEFEAIWGRPVNQAVELGVDVPEMLALRDKISAVLSGKN